MTSLDRKQETPNRTELGLNAEDRKSGVSDQSQETGAEVSSPAAGHWVKQEVLNLNSGGDPEFCTFKRRYLNQRVKPAADKRVCRHIRIRGGDRRLSVHSFIHRSLTQNESAAVVPQTYKQMKSRS